MKQEFRNRMRPRGTGQKQQQRRSRWLAPLAALALLANSFAPAAIFAQQINAAINGTVTNEREEIVPNANVIVESPQLGIERRTRTNEDGYFVVPNLPVGIYRVRVEAEGFTAYLQENIKLDVGNTFAMTVKLSVGAVSGNVDVTTDTFQTVNTETANVETLITGTQVTELSLNGRNWAQLINLAPGTASINSDSQQGTNVRIDDTAINGLRRRTAPTLDGASNVDHGSVGTLVNNISVDAIQEFKLVSSPYSAEYGAQAGPSVNVVTRRGTTEYHGSAFEFFRHDKLNAFSWESKQATNPEKPHLRFNNFGGFVGGPIYKSKLFFFGGLEYKWPRTGRTINELVPTEAMRRGDFSAFLPAGVAANNTSCTPAGITQTATRFILCDKSASTTGVAFPGNIIPASKMSPNGRAIVNLFPSPNAGLDRYIASPITVRNVRQELLRVDYQVNNNATIFGRWLRDYFDSDNPLGSSFDNQNMPIAPDNHVRDGKTFLGSYTQVFNSTLVNELNVAWQRNDQAISYQDEAQINRSTYGINFQELFSENRLNKIPQVAIQGYSQISGNGLPYTIDARNWELRDNLTKVWGAHTLKFGVQYINSFKSENTRVRDGGDITFSSGSDAGTAFRPQDSGNAVANLLLGAFTRYTEISNTTNAPTHYNQFEFYVNDQWKVNRRLSLTLGLRMQYIPWAVADDGNIVGFDPTRFDPAKAPLAANISGGVINLTADPTGQRTRAQGFFDPYNGLVLPRNSIAASDPNLARLVSDRPGGLATSGPVKFAPRVGFAWDPWGDGKTSVRGGGGIYYDRTLLNPLRDSGANAPFVSSGTVTNARQFTTPSTLTGLSGFVNPLDTIGAGGTGRPLVQTLAVFDFNMQPGVVYAYSLGFQRQVWWDTVLDISYVGNQARHLTHRRDINYVLPSVALETAASSVSATNPLGYTNRTTDTVRQYLGYSAIRSQENTGSSSYNSLQVFLQKRVSRGFTGSLAYTFSKALTNFDVETSDLRVPFDAGLDKGYANFNRPHVFSASLVYELPWMKKQKGLAGNFLGGWQVSSIINLQSGSFVNISGGSRAASSPSNGFGSNLDLVGDWRAVPGGQTPTPVFVNGVYQSGGYINRAAFAPRQGLIGNTPRNLIQMPSTETVNLSLMKRIRLTEGARLQFRTEVFNVFNHTNYRTLVTNFSASNFGALTETDEPRVIQFGLKLLF